MKTMYPAQVNSPGTELAAAIDAAQDTLQVADGSVLPDGPNLLTIGTDEAAETILYTGKTGDELTGITRGFQGTAQSWAAGTKVARYFTAYDHDAATSNISELSTGLNEARDRLDIEERQDVVLNAGMQILNAQRRAAFSLRGIKGRTLVNLLGRDGNCENVSRFTPWQATLAADTANRTQGSQSLKITTTATPGGSGASTGFPVKAGSYYLIVADVKLGSGTSIGAYINGLTSSKGNTNSTDTTKFKTVWKAYSVSADATVYAVGEVIGPSGSVGYVDAIRLYEMSAAEYAALDGMTPGQVAAKYPYVDSVQPVRNPYAIRYGENLLPPFYEWSIFNDLDAVTSRVLNGPYDTTLILAAASTNYIYLESPVLKVAAGSYQFNVEISSSISGSSKGAYIQLLYFDAYGERLGDTTKYTITSGNQGISTSIPQGTTTIKAVLGVDVGTTGTVTFKNPILNTGSTPKPFKPREDAMLALQTDLYANPVTGLDADEVFEENGQYFKLAKWKRIAIDGSFWVGLNALKPNFKWVVFNIPDGPNTNNIEHNHMTKYDGRVVRFINGALGTGSLPDQMDYDPGGKSVFFGVSNADSGWGDNYTPTDDEIKAYFMGWTMSVAGQPRTALYNGTGSKVWVKTTMVNNPSTPMVAGDYVSSMPTENAGLDSKGLSYPPYQLAYQLATPTVKPIVSEGMLTFNEGDNQIEIGTGIVLRESVKPKQHANTNWIINNTGVGSMLSLKASAIKEIYRSDRKDYKWIKESVSGAWGMEQAYISNANYDPSATYSVTYLMLDKSPIVPFSGSYAANEKAMLQELTDSVQQNATAVDVLMQQKVEKDQPIVWINPTLLNGWSNVSGEPLQFAKVGNRVQVTGRVTGGSIAAGVVLFRLPAGYRPKRTVTIPIYYSTGSASATGELVVGTDGSILLYIGGNAYLDCANVTFLAEH